MLSNLQPFAEFDNLFRSLERNVESVWHRPAIGQGVPIDIYEKPDALYIRACVPGAVDEDIDVSVDRHVVTLKGTIRCDYTSEDTKVYLLETPFGSFTRSVRLPESCDPEMAEAQLDRGVLTVRVPKREKAVTARKLAIGRKLDIESPVLEAQASQSRQKSLETTTTTS